MSSTNLDLKSITYQDQLRSKPVRENFTDVQNNFNALRTEVYASIASTAAEVVSARDGFSNLSDNINVRSVYGAGIATGGLVTAAGTPNNTVLITGGSGIVPNGAGVDWNAATSNTIAAVTKPRYVVAVINSDNSLALELGGTADDPILPTLAKTQMPLGGFLQSTAATVVINDSDIWDMRRQGVTFNGKYFHKVQDAVYEANGTVGGTIQVGPGRYYESIDLSGKSNLELSFDQAAVVYRPDDDSECIKCVNATTSESTNITISSANLKGNSKTGNSELLKFAFVDSFYVRDSIFDSNVSSTASYPNMKINNCDNFKMSGNQFLNSAGDFDTTTYNISTCTNYVTDDLLQLYGIIF
jgi:hypothetical protein